MKLANSVSIRPMPRKIKGTVKAAHAIERARKAAVFAVVELMDCGYDREAAVGSVAITLRIATEKATANPLRN